MNIHNIKKKIRAIFGKKKKVIVTVTKEEMQKAFSSEENFYEFINKLEKEIIEKSCK